MRRIYHYRTRRHTTSSKEGLFFKKENKESAFFDAPSIAPFFNANQTAVQRKYEASERSEKNVQRVEDKKEDDNKVMRAEEKEEDEKIQRLPEKKEEEEKVRKKEATTAAGQSSTTATTYIHSMNGKGQNLSPNLQSFYESRMGADFSDVKIHIGPEAAESAKEMSAQAFTYGHHIVFNEGRYRPETHEGKHLLAHELAHVAQNQPLSRQIIRRKAEFKAGKILKDINLATNYFTAVKLGVNNSHVGITTPFLNSINLTQAAKGNPLKTPSESDMTAVKQDEGYKSSVKNIPLNTFTYEMHIPVLKKIWKEYVDASDIKSNLKKACSGKINVYISGNPDSKTIVDAVQKHEEVHAAHWKELFDSLIVPFDQSMKDGNGQGATEKQSKVALVKRVEISAKSTFAELVRQYTQKAQDFHATQQGALAKFTAHNQDPDCTWVKIKVTI